MALLDWFKRPVQTGELKGEAQTAALSSLRREFADHPSRGLTPAVLAALLEQSERGQLTAQARLAEDMEEKDAHLYAELAKRKMALLRDWSLVAPADASAADKAAAARLEAMLRELDWESLVLALGDAVLKGYSCAEITWDRSGGEWRPAAIEHRPADWFMSRPEARDDLVLRSADGRGEELRPFGWVVHHHKAKSGYLARGGLVRVLAWPFLFKNYAVRDLAEFLEIYGLPLRLGKYPTGASEQEKATLLAAVVGIGHAAAGIIPESMAIEFEAAASGASDPYQAMVAWAERAISKAVLGGTLTSQTEGVGTYAMAKVHDEMRLELRASDLRQIGRTLTRDLVWPLAALNTRLARPPLWVFDTADPDDLELYGKAVPALVGVGARIPESWLREKLKYPAPEGDEPVLMAGAAPAAAPAAAKARWEGSVAGAGTYGTQGTDTPDAQADRLEAEAAQGLRAWLEQIRRWAEEAESLEALRNRLLEAYGDLPTEALAGVMGQAFAAAAAAGLYDQAAESGMAVVAAARREARRPLDVTVSLASPPHEGTVQRIRRDADGTLTLLAVPSPPGLHGMRPALGLDRVAAAAPPPDDALRPLEVIVSLVPPPPKATVKKIRREADGTLTLTEEPADAHEP